MPEENKSQPTENKSVPKGLTKKEVGKALVKTDGNLTEAAKLLGVSSSTMDYYKAKYPELMQKVIDRDWETLWN